jgi:P27 family predicted phage terminase small subunit
MPRTKKPAGTAVDSRNGRRADLSVVAGTRFDPPESVSDEARLYWDTYWQDRVAQVHTPVDRVILVRWVTELDRYFKLLAVADAQPIVTGSQGQPVENPAYGTAHRSLAAVQYCEKQLGVGPLNRSALGIAVVTEAKSLGELNAAYGGGSGAGPQSVEGGASPQGDPRVVNISSR